MLIPVITVQQNCTPLRCRRALWQGEHEGAGAQPFPQVLPVLQAVVGEDDGWDVVAAVAQPVVRGQRRGDAAQGAVADQDPGQPQRPPYIALQAGKGRMAPR